MADGPVNGIRIAPTRLTRTALASRRVQLVDLCVEGVGAVEYAEWLVNAADAITDWHGEGDERWLGWRRDGVLEWSIPLLNAENAEGNIELSVSGGSNDEFFPVSVNFNSTGTYAGLKIEGVETADGANVDYTSEVNFLVDSYDYV